MTPATQALAFRIWQYCEPRGWDCTHGEVAQALGAHRAAVTRAVFLKGWTTRFRASKKSHSNDGIFLGTQRLAAEAAAQFRGVTLDE